MAQYHPQSPVQPTEHRIADDSALPDSRDQLLALVIGETLTRDRDDPGALFQSLRNWRLTHFEESFDEQACTAMVQEVIRFRIGTAVQRIPETLFREVGTVLWNDPASRERITRLWSSLGATP